MKTNLHTLSVENLHKDFVQGNVLVPVLCGITATFVQGNSYAIMGMSGSGKSTLVQLLAGLDDPTRGTVSFDGRSLASLSAQEKNNFLNRSIGLVFQKSYLMSELSLLENISLPGLIGGMSYHMAQKHAQEVLHVVGLKGYEHHHPQALSGGQQQRVVLARALYNRPAFLIADEPTGSLDKKTATTIIDLLCCCQKEWGMGLIISTHDESIADRLTNRCTMSNGLLLQQ